MENYREVWAEHVGTLGRIGLYLPERADRLELTILQQKLMHLIKKASEQEKKEAGASAPAV